MAQYFCVKTAESGEQAIVHYSLDTERKNMGEFN